ncbi:MAG: zinc dependent phospholipase C family protein [Clostridia bacterium]|nr:zinc dependent phospholipase C family protein [Clostridia bacterium]
MATWIVHLRIADTFIKEKLIPDKYKREFIYGSLAPDCGYGVKDSFGEFSPPPSVTHWAPNGCKVFCEYNDFYEKYLKEKEQNDAYYFYLGYYTHLITDVLWSMSIYMPTRYKYANEYAQDPMYLNTVKKDWYGLDYKFLSENPDFEAYKLLCSIDSVSDYLPYYEAGQLTKQLKYIADYYKTNLSQPFEYKFLSPVEVNEFIKTASSLIKTKIKEFTV